MKIEQMLRREDTVSNFICDRLYHIIYRDYAGDIKTVRGLLIHYACGNVDLVNSLGGYHIAYKDIVFMEPIAFAKLKGPKDFLLFVNEYLGEKIYECI